MGKTGDIQGGKEAQIFTLATCPCAGGQLQGFKGLEVDVNTTGRARGRFPRPKLFWCVTAGGFMGKTGDIQGGKKPRFFTLVTCPCAGGQL